MKIFVLFLFLLLTAVTANASPSYRATDLGTLGGKSSSASAINDCGDIVGEAETSRGYQHAFLWRRGIIRDLGCLPGDMSGKAQALNNSRQVVGYSGIGSQTHAFMWHSGRMTHLIMPSAGNEWASAINDRGQIVGNTDLWTDASRSSSVGMAYLWQDGKVTFLGGGRNVDTMAEAINNKGQILYTSNAGGGLHLMVWNQGLSHATQVTNWGGGGYDPYAFNDAGQFCGQQLQGEYSSRGTYLWQYGPTIRRQSLIYDALPNRMFAINDKGMVVGYYLSPHGSGADRAEVNTPILWRRGKSYELQSLLRPHSGWTLQIARSINNRGQIVGEGIHNGHTRAFLLTPVKQ